MSTMSPCAKQHSLELIKECSDCRLLFELDSNVALPKELLDASVRCGLVDRIDVGKDRFYSIEHLHKLQKLDEKGRKKILYKASKGSSTHVPSHSRSPSPTQRVESPLLLRPSKTEVKRHDSEARRHEEKEKIKSPIAIQTPIVVIERDPVISVTLPTIAEQLPTGIKSSRVLPEDICMQCQQTVGKLRKCTNDYLCELCRRLPEHRIMSETQMFRQFPDLCYRDINEGIRKKIVRHLIETPFGSFNGRQISTRYFYEQDIEHLMSLK